jgi:hypothetical protein
VKKDVVEIMVSTSYRHDGAFVEIRAKAGDLSEVVKNMSKILDILLQRRNEYRRIIRIERGAEDRASTPELV